MDNYMEYNLMGLVSQVRMKPGCIPTKHECQPDRRNRTSTTTQRPYILKKHGMMAIEESEKDLLTKSSEPISSVLASADSKNGLKLTWPSSTPQLRGNPTALIKVLATCPDQVVSNNQLSTNCTTMEDEKKHVVRNSNLKIKTQTEIKKIVKSTDVELKVEPDDFDGDINLFIKRKPVLNGVTEDFYDLIVKEELVPDPEIIQNNAEIEKEVSDFRDDNVIKQELVLNSGIEIDDFVENQYVKKEGEIVNTETDDICKHHIVKEEFENSPEVIRKDFTDRLNNYVEIISADKNVLYRYEVVKEELDISPETTQDDEVLDECLNEEGDRNSDNLYKDHIVKDELVIGPETVQKIVTPTKYIEKDITTCHSKQYNCEKCSSFVDIKESNHKCEFICDYCQKSFHHRYTVLRHISNKHNVHKRPSKNKCVPFRSSHNCDLCGKKFTYPSNLARHLKIHSGMKPHRCTQCLKSFARKDYLNFHVMKHHLNTPIPSRYNAHVICDLCNKEFSKKCSLDHHKRHSCPMNKNRIKFSRNKVYSCDVCDKSYEYRSSLSAHIVRRHTNMSLGPMHQCDFCGKKYVKKHNLQCHMQSKHLNLHPYSCKMCNEKFTWHSTLAAHERKIHGKGLK